MPKRSREEDRTSNHYKLAYLVARLLGLRTYAVTRQLLQKARSICPSPSIFSAIVCQLVVMDYLTLPDMFNVVCSIPTHANQDLLERHIAKFLRQGLRDLLSSVYKIPQSQLLLSSVIGSNQNIHSYVVNGHSLYSIPDDPNLNGRPAALYNQVCSVASIVRNPTCIYLRLNNKRQTLLRLTPKRPTIAGLPVGHPDHPDLARAITFKEKNLLLIAKTRHEALMLQTQEHQVGPGD
jgi:hypothetical protein